MAQTGYTPIRLYYSSTTTNAPLAANLASGELALNAADGKLFYKDTSSAVQVIGWKTTPTSAGGTGLTSPGASGNVLSSNGTSWSSIAPPWGDVTLNGVQTLTNKTLTSPSLATPLLTGTPSTTAGRVGFDTGASVPTYYDGSTVQQVGYLNIPQNNPEADYITVLSDAGKHLFHSGLTGTVLNYYISGSVPYPIGTAITFINYNPTFYTNIGLTGGLILRLAGSGATGVRTLTGYGMATAVKVGATDWIISGTNLS